jgi:hypothetical protein
MKRTGWLRRGKPLRRGKGIRQMSEKRRETLPTRREVRIAVLARDGGCRGRLIVPEVQCMGLLEVDEIVNRGRKPGGELDVDNAQALCRAHHRWKGENPVEAEKRGLWMTAGGNSSWAEAKELARQALLGTDVPDS